MLGLVYLSNPPLLAAIFVSGKAEIADVDILHQQLTTQAGAKIVPALRVVAEKAPLRVARCLFRITKRLSSRLD